VDKKPLGQSGNIFFALFGAVALVGILGAGVMTFMKGPLATSVKITRINTAETQMALGAQVAVMSAANGANNGDCDSDTYVEPSEWRDAGTSPKPTGGGLIPLTLGISKKDPWGTEYGYCVWNHGPITSGSGCGANMLGGTNSSFYPVVAIISAGIDKVFTTTCRDFSTADANADGDLEDAGDSPLVSKAVETDDDIIFSYTYEEATGASGGLWSIKSGDPDTAVIDKKIEATGTASFAGGVLLPDSSLITCDATTAGVMARNASGGIDICNGATWDAISGGGGAADGFSNDNTIACDGTTAGQVRYNTTSELPEFCNGTDWLPFTINIPGINLVLSPQQQNGMDIDADNNVDPGISGICDDTIYMCGNPVTFTLSNSGTLQSSTIVISLTNSTNFYVKAETCTVSGGNADGKLDPNESCTIDVIPKADGNVNFTGNLQISTDNSPFSILQGTATNFGCVAGRQGGGGYYAGCGISDPDGTYDLIVMPGGCSGSTLNPVCGTNMTADSAATATYGPFGESPVGVTTYPTQSSGAQQHQNIMAYAGVTGTSWPAANYCDSMVYNGYADWFLPSYKEWEYIRLAASAGKFSLPYLAWKLSDMYGSTNQSLEFVGGSSMSYRADSRGNAQKIRCVRRESLPLPSPVTDIDPDNVSVRHGVVFSSGGSYTSNTVTITGILQTITVSISGGTGMDIIWNGTPQGSTSISGVKLNDTLAFTMDAPSVLGTKNSATISIGSDTYTWWVGYGDSTVTGKIFVTSSSHRGSDGGLTTYDSYCNSDAANSPLGLSAKWKAIMSDETVDAYDRIPWNWKTLYKTDGTTVVSNGIGDLFDGSLASAIDVDESGNTRITDVFTGSTSSGFKISGSTASSWTTGYVYAAEGSSSSSSSTWIYKGTESSNTSNGIYCIEDVDDMSDTTPANMSIPYKTLEPLSSVVTSDQIAVGGMSNGATQTLSVSATGGSPNFDVERGGSTIATGVTSYTVQNSDKITFHMTSPAVASSSYKMTATAGSMTAYWRVWTGPATTGVVKHIFVTAADVSGSSFGGASGADTVCKSKANAAGHAGDWKAVLSGTAETDWAVNRVGYNWDELRLVDDSTVVTTMANGGLWSTLLHAIDMDETGTQRASARILSGTKSDGSTYSTASDLSNLFNWTAHQCSATYMQGNSSSLSAVITQGYWLCTSAGALFCIEQ